jgi:hypothetical protein
MRQQLESLLVPETATIKCMSWSRVAMGGYRTVASRAGDAIDQSDEPATLGGPARLDSYLPILLQNDFNINVGSMTLRRLPAIRQFD